MSNVPREMPEMTPRQRWNNWWRYHWLYVLAGVLAALMAVGTAWKYLSRVESDCGAALVCRGAVTQEELSALEAVLEAAAADTNGDGRVRVSVSHIPIDFTASDLDEAALRQMTANVERLYADFFTGQSGLFILDDPENFQRNHAALRYLDGTEPPEGAVDWENMVLPWSGSPALAGLTFQNLDTASLYLGRRIGEGFDGAEALWKGLYPNS